MNIMLTVHFLFFNEITKINDLIDIVGSQVGLVDN